MDHSGDLAVNPSMDLKLNDESTAEPSMDANGEPNAESAMDFVNKLSIEPVLVQDYGLTSEPAVDQRIQPSLLASMDLDGELSIESNMDLNKNSSTELTIDHNNEPSTEPSMETNYEPVTSPNMEADKELKSLTGKGPEFLDIEDRLLKLHTAPLVDRRAKLAAAQKQLAQRNKHTLMNTTQIPKTVTQTGRDNTPRTESSGTTPETAQSPQTVNPDGVATIPNMKCNEMVPLAAMSSQGGGASALFADEPSVTEIAQSSYSDNDYLVLPGHGQFPTSNYKFPTVSDENDALFVPPDNITMDSIEALQAFTYDQPSEIDETVIGEPIAPPGDTAANDDTRCEDPEWPETLLNSVNDQDSSDFEKVKAWFEGLSNPTMEDRFHYEAAKLENDARQKRLENRKALEKQPVLTSEEFHFNEYGLGNTSRNRLRDTEVTDNTKVVSTKPTTARRKRPNRISESEKRRSMQIGLDVILGPLLNKEKPRKHRNNDSTQPGPSKRSRKNKEIALQPFLGSDLFEVARANSSLPGIPACSAKNKVKALLELIANVPIKGQKEAMSDKQKVLKATRKFTKSARSDGKGGWKIKGLDTSLYHHQLLGAGFMRDRENSTHAPFGGLMCDFMGFGKTIQALANIIDGQPCEPNDPLKTTLIVVPSHLMQHWKNQILKHCDMDAMGKVLVYCAHSRMETLDLIKDIQNFFVVITTYDEIRRSYPRCIKPETLEDEDTIREWWSEAYEKNIGPLHLIKFLRIILDEGHVIKNHASQTSIAVRALTGKFKWILSGAPIHNMENQLMGVYSHLKEFYPYFDFLGVPQLGDFREFVKHYCKDDEAVQRLLNLLRSFMIKRTHESKLFSLPVIKLPDLDEEVVVVNFCEAERTIYEGIVDWFINNMNDLAEAEDSKLTQSRCFLTMVLVLRMFCSHILNTQKIVKRLLSGPFMQDLRNISEYESTVSQDTSQRIIAWLLALKKDTGLRPPKQPLPEDAGQLVEKIRGDSMKLVGQFRQLMCELHEEGNWVERLERTSCAACRLQPVNTVIADCMHLYCEECFYLISDENPASKGRLCAKCNSNIKEAAQCCFSEDMALDNPSLSQVMASTGKQQTREKTRISKKNPRETSRKIVSPRTHSDESGGEDEDTDWIVASNGDMPGAKLSKILELIRAWIVDNPGVKIVVFTQFLDFVQILVASLRREGIPCVCLTGKMRPEYRAESMDKFSEDSSLRVMIASLKAGGIGLDLTAAHKCILVDLWWNEAIQDQAFCRLWRIGQNKPVMCIKMIVKDTIDDYLLRLQLKKTAEINSTMDAKVLENHSTVKSLLEMFGAIVKENENGTFSVTRNWK